jgi:phospholipase/carboxylesterase
MSQLPDPAVSWQSPDSPDKPLLVLLHGRGSRETDILALADYLPLGPSYAAVRAPIAEGPGFAWFANRGIGRPVAESLAETMAWFRGWLETVAPAPRPVILVGFSGGAAFAGGLILDDPERFAGAAILRGTLPFDAGVPTTPGRLQDVPMFVAHGDADAVIPGELLKSTWSYLTAESGAQTMSVRAAGGHSIGQDDVTALARWITGLQDQ